MSKVVTQLNQIQADAHALFVKFHDYHWYVKGIQFFSVHEYTEKAYEDMAEIFDDVAERAIQLGGRAITKIEELNKLAHPKTDNKDSYTPTEVLKGVLAEYEHLLGEFKKLEEVAEEAKDSTTVTIAGSPSGIADTASDTAVINISSVGILFITPTVNIIAQAAKAIKPKYLLS